MAPAGSGTLVAMAPQFIYTMRDLRRFYPPDREVLKGINLSFYPGAKIGVIGSNGSGKSSLLRIMAGEDDGFTGEARLTPGFTRRATCPRSPSSTRAKDVAGNVAEGVGETKALVDRFNEVCAAFGEPDADIDALLAEQSDLQTKIDAAGAWDLDRTFEIAMDALRSAAGRRRRLAPCPAVSDAGSRSAACCSRSPTCCCSTSRPTTSTPSRSRGSSARCRTIRARSSR